MNLDYNIEVHEATDISHRFPALYSTKGQGAKVKLATVAGFLPDLIEQHNGKLKPVLEILDKEHGMKVCKLTLQNYIKGNISTYAFVRIDLQLWLDKFFEEPPNIKPNIYMEPVVHYSYYTGF